MANGNGNGNGKSQKADRGLIAICHLPSAICHLPSAMTSDYTVEVVR